LENENHPRLFIFFIENCIVSWTSNVETWVKESKGTFYIFFFVLFLLDEVSQTVCW
jgi:hypothetical protein